jgi:hypothetical protein
VFVAPEIETVPISNQDAQARDYSKDNVDEQFGEWHMPNQHAILRQANDKEFAAQAHAG